MLLLLHTLVHGNVYMSIYHHIIQNTYRKVLESISFSQSLLQIRNLGRSKHNFFFKFKDELNMGHFNYSRVTDDDITARLRRSMLRPKK